MTGLNNVTTAAQYTNANTAQTPGATQFIITISNAAVYLQFSAVAGGVANPFAWQDENFYIPGYYTIPLRSEAIRVRSAVAASPAQVTVNVF